MMVNMGKPQAFVGKVPEFFHPLGDRNLAVPELLKKRFQIFLVHVPLLYLCSAC
jgi:hypothetical protein